MEVIKWILIIITICGIITNGIDEKDKLKMFIINVIWMLFLIYLLFS